MTDNDPEVRALPVANADTFKSSCQSMIDWLGTIEMPEERVGIHEAGGNLGGILVGLMLGSRACFYTEEAANVADLCGYLKNDVGNPDKASILAAIQECAVQARDEKRDIEVEFR